MSRAHNLMNALLAEQSRRRIGNSPLTDTAHRLDITLRQGAFPYALIGGYAVQQYGYRRFTEDIDVVVSQRQAAHDYLVATGLFKPVAGSKMTVVDKATGVPVDLLPSGRQDSPGAYAYPDPATQRDEAGIKFVDLECLIALKLHTGRAKDEADVIELIKFNNLPGNFMLGYPAATKRYDEVWAKAQVEIMNQMSTE